MFLTSCSPVWALQQGSNQSTVNSQQSTVMRSGIHGRDRVPVVGDDDLHVRAVGNSQQSTEL